MDKRSRELLILSKNDCHRLLNFLVHIVITYPNKIKVELNRQKLDLNTNYLRGFQDNVLHKGKNNLQYEKETALE